MERPTVKARNARKYFGRGKGVVAYTLLCNHLTLCCADDPALYEKCLIRPAGQIDRQAIEDEKSNAGQAIDLDAIMAGPNLG